MLFLYKSITMPEINTRTKYTILSYEVTVLQYAWEIMSFTKVAVYDNVISVSAVNYQN